MRQKITIGRMEIPLWAVIAGVGVIGIIGGLIGALVVTSQPSDADLLARAMVGDREAGAKLEARYAEPTIPFRGSQRASVGSSDKYVAGVGQQHPIMATADHIAAGRTARYSTTPPTSGDHWAVPANCGFYTAGLPDEQTTHNLEHGNIVVSYNLTSQEEVAQLRKVLDGIDLNPIWGVTRFYDKLEPGTVALATWGVLDSMKGIDRERVKKFFDTYAGRLGPEQVPC